MSMSLVYSKMKALTSEQIHSKQIGIFMMKSSHNLLPRNLSDIFTRRVCNVTRSTRADDNDFYVSLSIFVVLWLWLTMSCVYCECTWTILQFLLSDARMCIQWSTCFERWQNCQHPFIWTVCTDNWFFIFVLSDRWCLGFIGVWTTLCSNSLILDAIFGVSVI